MKKVLINILFTFSIVFVIFLIFINISLEKLEEENELQEESIQEVEIIKEEISKDIIIENIKLNASKYQISLKDIIDQYNGRYNVLIDHYEKQPFYPANDQLNDILANFMHHYIDCPNIEFHVVYIDSGMLYNYAYMDVHIENEQLYFGDEMHHVNITSTSIQLENIKEENQQLKDEGIEVLPYSHLFSHLNLQHLDNYKEYEDLSKYHSYDEFWDDHPDLTEDDAIEIFEAYQNRD